MAAPKLQVEIEANAGDAVRGFDRAGDAAEEMSNRVRRAGSRARVANDNFRKASRGSSSFGRSMQNVSFQVGDFATQVGAGTSASIALGQQLPQLLGGFGVLGAAIGAVVAIGVPLTRVLGEMETSAADLEKVFGVLTPAMLAIGDALSVAKDLGIAAIEGLINNLDSLLISGGLVAGFFAGKYVVSMVAAKAATISLSGALAVLKKALLVTGIGAIVVATGHLIERFLALRQQLGSFGEAAMVVGKTIEASFTHVWARIEASWFETWHDLLNGLVRILDGKMPNIANKLIGLMEPLSDAYLSAARKAAEAGAMHDKLMSKILSAGRTGQFSLGDMFKGGGEDDDDAIAQKAAESERERLAAKMKAITDTFRTEKEMLYQQLAEKNQILNEAHALELMTEQEHLLAKEALHQQHADKLKEIEKTKRQTLLAETSGLFGSLSRLASAGGKKMANIAKGFAIVESVISTYAAANKVLNAPHLAAAYPANIIAAAATIGTGLANVAAIAGVNTNGGASSASGGGRGAAAAPATPPLEVLVQGLGPNDLISGGQLSSLFDKLVDEAGDRGIRPVFA